MLDLSKQPAVQHALALIRGRFEEGDIENMLPYHNSKHTMEVLERTQILSTALNLSLREQTLAVIAAAFHDTVQSWECVECSKGSLFRKRCTLQNEQESAKEAANWMHAHGEFTEEEILLVQHAILSTIPYWNPNLKTVYQKHPPLGGSVLATAVALADLGAVGMDAECFRETGDKIFLEEQLDITRTLRGFPLEFLEEDVRKWFLKRYHTWAEGQESFVLGRQVLLNQDTAHLSEEQQKNVRKLFSQFSTSVLHARDYTAFARNCTFEAFAERLCPQIPQ